MTDFNIVLFDDFETLDAFGPAEVIGNMQEDYKLGCYSLHGGIVTSKQQVQVATVPFSDMNKEGVLLIPGGIGTRKVINEADFISELADAANKAPFVLTVCTGSALLAKTGLLDSLRATSNKKAFAWVQSVTQTVKWVKKARWVVDGRFYTSSGVSAGIDMILGFISDLHGHKVAQDAADYIEYIWNTDKDLDPFAC